MNEVDRSPTVHSSLKVDSWSLQWLWRGKLARELEIMWDDAVGSLNSVHDLWMQFSAFRYYAWAQTATLNITGCWGITCGAANPQNWMKFNYKNYIIFDLLVKQAFNGRVPTNAADYNYNSHRIIWYGVQIWSSILELIFVWTRLLSSKWRVFIAWRFWKRTPKIRPGNSRLRRCFNESTVDYSAKRKSDHDQQFNKNWPMEGGRRRTVSEH